MKIVFIFLYMTLSLFAQELVLKKGFVSAHTQTTFGDIDPLNTFLQANITMNENNILNLKGTFFLKMALFSSDNFSRDKHMHEANMVTDFPLAKFMLTNIEKTNDDNSYILKGRLNFLGKTKLLQAQAQILDTAKEIEITAVSKIDAESFGLEMPCLLFICVDKNIDLYIKAVFIK